MEEKIELSGHIIDNQSLSKVMDSIIALGGSFEFVKIKIGKTKEDESYAKILIRTDNHEMLERILDEVSRLGAAFSNTDAKTAEAPADGILPEGFYTTTNLPTLVRIGRKWIETGDIEMDCPIIIDGNQAVCKRQGKVKRGEKVVIDSEGVRVIMPPKVKTETGFGFMQSDISSEKPLNPHLEATLACMKEAKKDKKRIIFVVGTAIVHTGGDESLKDLVKAGYVDAIFCGNGFATMDIEKQMFGTTLGMDAKTGAITKAGSGNHLVAINRINKAGGIDSAVKKGILTGGVMYECIKKGVPVVIGGSLRDDGPLADTITDVMEAQDRMREVVKGAGVCVILATMLHGIATGNMLPSSVKTICLDMNPYVVNRLRDRGTNHAMGVISDGASFLKLLANELCE
jgi:lysine-ketoglutarate reductase/saccharopine dehydrogenase-like protein (TIGR00300 family)